MAAAERQAMEPRERPILFSSPHVRAILDGRKTVTRRPVRPGVLDDGWPNVPPLAIAHAASRCPYGGPGDRLWVRETWRVASSGRHYPTQTTTVYVEYREQSESHGHERGRQHRTRWTIDDSASDVLILSAYGNQKPYRWRPSIHMPRWASRILLEVLDVRVERVQAITEDDARAEGCESDVDVLGRLTHLRGSDAARSLPSRLRSARDEFRAVWDRAYGKDPALAWAANPWVWRVAFRRVEAMRGAP